MYDELVKRLRKLAEEQFFDYERQPYLQAADAIEELLKAREQELPTKGALRMIIRACDGDPYKIGRHFLEVYARLQNRPNDKKAGYNP